MFRTIVNVWIVILVYHCQFIRSDFEYFTDSVAEGLVQHDAAHRREISVIVGKLIVHRWIWLRHAADLDCVQCLKLDPSHGLNLDHILFHLLCLVGFTRGHGRLIVSLWWSLLLSVKWGLDPRPAHLPQLDLFVHVHLNLHLRRSSSRTGRVQYRPRKVRSHVIYTYNLVIQTQCTIWVLIAVQVNVLKCLLSWDDGNAC